MLLLAELSILFFYVAFKPFQMAYYDFNTLVLVWCAYAVLSFLVLCCGLQVVPALWPLVFEKWISTKKGRLLFTTVLISGIGTSFFAFEVGFGFYEINLRHLLTGALSLGAFLVFPLAFLSWVDHDPVPEAIEEEIVLANEPEIELGPKHSSILLSQFLYVYSDKNYVVWVCFIDNTRKEFKVRETLTSVEERIAGFDTIKRCHRAYLVNTEYVTGVSKFGSSFQLKLQHVKEAIPLSRNCSSHFK